MSDSDPQRSLAEKIDHLFRTVHPRDRGEFSHDEVAAAIQRNGVSVSGSYLWLLRTGRRDNPTKRHIEALAKFFGVPPSYFFDDEEAARIDAELDFLMALRDVQVRQIALRARGLSPELQSTIQTLIEQVIETQQQRTQPGSKDEPGAGDNPA